jgi:cytochrome c oxidase subunit 2
MFGYVIALSLAVLFTSAPVFAQEPSGLIARGKELFVEQGCYGCHTMGKMGTPIGPDLSAIGSKHPQAYLERWVRDPSAQKPTAHMPKLDLTEEEVRALAAYLASLR